MNLLLSLAEYYVPGFVKRRKLCDVFTLTAEAFKVKPPALHGLGYPELLKMYAQFSAATAARLLKTKTGAKTGRQRLARLAFAYGMELRRQYRIQDKREALRMAKIVYQLSGIAMTASHNGDFFITRCFFEDYYSREICHLMSGLDEGLLTGLSGCSNLKFSERLTAGHAQCRARLE